DPTSATALEIDIPQGGISYIIGNVIYKGESAITPIFIAQAEEGLQNPGNQLYIINNTFSNLMVKEMPVLVKAVANPSLTFIDNAILGLTAGKTIETDAAQHIESGNRNAVASDFVNPADYNFKLTSRASEIGAAVPQGSVNGQSLVPDRQYDYDSTSIIRKSAGDVGAFSR
ncbi:MAG: hypothetical protein ACRD3W_16550, partial [Terriglobales bacterium]